MKTIVNDVVISTMNLSDMQLALDWADAEGWNPGLHDAQAFYYTDPGGFFMARLNGCPAGIISAVAYDPYFGFIGFFIVRPEYRGHNLAMLLGRKAFAYLGNRNIGLDGVPERIDNYRAFGFSVAHGNTRYTGTALGTVDSGVVPLIDIPFSSLLAFDQKVSGFQRQTFLMHWINQPGGYALSVPDDDGSLLGYGVIRSCRRGYKIGPLFALRPDVARLLFDNLCGRITGEQVFIDVPDNHAVSTSMVLQAGMTPVFSTARMYSGGIPESDTEAIYGITSFELG